MTCLPRCYMRTTTSFSVAKDRQRFRLTHGGLFPVSANRSHCLFRRALKGKRRRSESESEYRVSQIIHSRAEEREERRGQKCRGRACKNSRHSGAVATPSFLPSFRARVSARLAVVRLSRPIRIFVWSPPPPLFLLFCLSHFIGKTVRCRKTTTSLCTVLLSE